LIERLRASNEWKFAGVIGQVDGPLAAAWWSLLVLRGLLPALFAIAMGTLVSAVQRHGELAAPLAMAGIVFVLLQVLPPIHHATGANLGSRVAAPAAASLWAAARPMPEAAPAMKATRPSRRNRDENSIIQGF